MPFQPIIQAASSLPTGGTFAAGSGKISTSGSVLTITQSSLRGIVDWRTFSIGNGSTVSFKNGSGVTLNRVMGGTPSTLLGQLLATGNIYLLNPQGVLVGKGATVRTGGDFVASTLTLPVAQFLSGAPLVFSGSSDAAVVNLGAISSSGGNIYLIGRSVQNGGSLSSPNGTSGLAAGSQVLISDSSEGQKVSVQAPGGDVTNTGFINAAQVELRSNGGNIYALAGSNGGYINATGTANIDGHVWLIATNGSTTLSSQISVANSDGKGGNVETSGAHVNADGASIKTGVGGNWLLDPADLTIDSGLASTIESSLNGGTNVTEQTGSGNTSNGDIFVNSPISWTTGADLTFSAFRNIQLNAAISNTGAGNLMLRADNTSTGNGTINGSGVIDFSGSTGNVALLYNPSSYASPTSYSANFSSVSGSWTAPANGSVSSQYTAYMLVNSPSDLQNINLNESATYALGRNIDLSSIPNFSPIGSDDLFTGTFDGQGHTINGLTINDSVNASLGLFALNQNGSQLRNVSLTNVDITETASSSGLNGLIGALTAYNRGAISNVNVGGVIHAGPLTAEVGGLAGKDRGTILNSSSSLTIDASATTTQVFAGALVGEAGGPIENSYATGDLNAPNAASSAYLGGLAGLGYSSITNSYATGAVTGSAATYIGGLIGSSSGTIANSYATGIVSDGGNGYGYVGGLAGGSSGTISGSHATGAVTVGVVAFAGGLVGYNTGPISNSYATGSTSGGASSAVGGLAGYTNAAISGSYATGVVQATDATAQYIGGLVGQADVGGAITSSYATGNVTGDEHAGGLTGANADIIANSYATGSVTGNAYSYIPDVLGGLSGSSSGPITNSYATGAVTVSNNAYSTAGGLVGNSSSTISNSYASGAVLAPNTNNLVGGLVGQSSAAISGSYATGMITAGDSSDIGGLAGQTQSGGTITNSYATGAVVCGAACAAGGLVGSAGDAISTSYAMGAVSGGGDGSTIGGLVGDANSSLTDTYARGAVTLTINGEEAEGGLVGTLESTGSVTNSYSSGAVTGYFFTGGLVGINNGSSNITNSYWDIEASGVPAVGVASGDDSGVTGLTTAQLQSGIMPTGFNGSNTVWTAPLHVYPYFGWQGPLVQIQGTAFSGSSALGSAGIGVLWNGSEIAATTTQSSGYYGVQVPQNMTVGGVLTYLTSGGVANTFSDGTGPYHFLNMGLDVGALSIINAATTTLSGLTSALQAAIGNNTGSNFLYGVPNGLLNLNSGATLQLANYQQFTIDQPLTTSGNILIEDLQSVTIASGNPVSPGAGNHVVIAVGLGNSGATFTNLAGAGAFNVSGGGNWLVYSNNPVNDNTGGLVPAYFQYDASPLATPAQSGNGLLYTLAPVITPFLTGTVSKIYDGTTAATLLPANFSSSGAINGDTVTFTNPSGVTYATANAGSGIEVTASGVAISSVSNGNIPVYGYQLTQAPPSGNIGTIHPATLTYTANSGNRTYSADNPAFNGTVTGFVNGETLSTATSGTAAFASGATALSNVGLYAIDGSGLTANNGNYLFTQADANASALSIYPATLTYVADAGTRAFGTGNPVFSGTVTGFVNGQTLAGATTGTAAFASSAGSTSPVGTYAIDGSGLNADYGNYVFTQASTNATALTITAASIVTPPPPPTVPPPTVPPPTQNPTVLNFVIGNTTGLQNSKPIFTATYTGTAVSGVDISSILSSLTFTITPSLSGPGTYTIMATGNAPAGYALTIAPATLTIVGTNPAVLPTQVPVIPAVVPQLLPNPGGNEDTSLLQPMNSVGLFQVNVTGIGTGFGASFIGFGNQQTPLAQSGFFGTNDKKDTYSAGAKP